MTFSDLVIITEALGALKEHYQEQADEDIKYIEKIEDAIKNADEYAPASALAALETSKKKQIDMYGFNKKKVADIIRCISKIERMKMI